MINSPIDIVIPVHEKDINTLELVIRNARKYVKNVHNIYVVSKEQYTPNAIWIDEALYPFTINDIKELIPIRAYWYYQQLLKLYVFKVITNLSDNCLILDAETIFYKPVSFIDEDGKALYCTSKEKHFEYYNHIYKLIKVLEVNEYRSGIVHHMLFQRDIVNELLSIFDWKMFISSVSPAWYTDSGASEYELYFCYVFTKHPNKVKIRELRWELSEIIQETHPYFDFLTCHIHDRAKKNKYKFKTKLEDFITVFC